MGKTLFLGIICGAVMTLGVFAALQMAGVQVWQEAQVEIEIVERIVIMERDIPPSPHGGTWGDYERLNGYLILDVLDTGSMEPVLNGESKIVVSTQPLHIGDIALWEDGSERAVHRIIGEQGDYWIFKGDANNFTEFIPKSVMILKVIAILY